MVRKEDTALCQRLIRAGAVPVADLVACAEQQRAALRAGDPVPSLGELLLRRGALAPDALRRIEAGGQTAQRRRRRAGDSSGVWRPGWGGLSDEAVHPGDRLGDFEVVEPIARGSMGAVYLARCVRSGRRVALKVLVGERARRDVGARRFLHEAELLCSLRHPGLVRGLAVGHDRGRRFFAMEYFPAPSLKHLLRQGPLGPVAVAEVGAAAARALAYLHGEGVVHRDVKPANLLVDLERGQARLCDLGLARELDLPSEATASADTLGTPCYMAPEQARDAKEVGPASDLYSLGVTLYHAVSGRPPFPEESGIVVLSRHLFDTIPDLRETRPRTPRALAEVVWRLTRKDPSARFPSAEAAALALEACAVEAPVARAA